MKPSTWSRAKPLRGRAVMLALTLCAQNTLHEPISSHTIFSFHPAFVAPSPCFRKSWSRLEHKTGSHTLANHLNEGPLISTHSMPGRELRSWVLRNESAAHRISEWVQDTDLLLPRAAADFTGPSSWGPAGLRRFNLMVTQSSAFHHGIMLNVSLHVCSLLACEEFADKFDTFVLCTGPTSTVISELPLEVGGIGSKIWESSIALACWAALNPTAFTGLRVLEVNTRTLSSCTSLLPRAISLAPTRSISMLRFSTAG